MVGGPSNSFIVAGRDIWTTNRPARVEPVFGAQLNLVDPFCCRRSAASCARARHYRYSRQMARIVRPRRPREDAV
jgi:hypothetical protein